RIQHEIQQIFLVRDMPVQRHRACTDLRGEATHSQRLQALSVGQLDGGAHDLLTREPWALALRLPRWAHPDRRALEWLRLRVRGPVVLPAVRLPLMSPDWLFLDRLFLAIWLIL